MFRPSETQSIVNPRQSWSPAILCLAMTSWRFLRELTSRNLSISLGAFSFARLPLAERSTASCKLSDISAFLYLRNKEWSQIQTSVSSSTSSVSLANATECSEALRVVLRWKNTRPGFSCVIVAWTCRVSASRNVSISVCIYLVIVSSCVSTNKRLTLRPFQSNPWYVAVSLDTVDALRAHGSTRSKCDVHLYRPYTIPWRQCNLFNPPLFRLRALQHLNRYVHLLTLWCANVDTLTSVVLWSILFTMFTTRFSCRVFSEHLSECSCSFLGRRLILLRLSLVMSHALSRLEYCQFRIALSQRVQELCVVSPFRPWSRRSLGRVRVSSCVSVAVHRLIFRTARGYLNQDSVSVLRLLWGTEVSTCSVALSVLGSCGPSGGSNPYSKTVSHIWLKQRPCDSSIFRVSSRIVKRVKLHVCFRCRWYAKEYGTEKGTVSDAESVLDGFSHVIR